VELANRPQEQRDASIISWNVNGLRSASEEVVALLLDRSPSALCLQEVRVDAGTVPSEVLAFTGYIGVLASSTNRGHAGVMVLCRDEPHSIAKDPVGITPYEPGRSVLVNFHGHSILNVYVPHGGRDRSRIKEKLAFLNDLKAFLSTWDGPPLIVTGDFNVARQPIDLARPSQNQDNTMFSATEREALEAAIGPSHIDTFRHHHPDSAKYTWWPYAFTARERNIGWRIDYVFAPKSMASDLRAADMLTNVTGSDHCPVEATLLLPHSGPSLDNHRRAPKVQE
jgi:exodeoxyribonuclease-3